MHFCFSRPVSHDSLLTKSTTIYSVGQQSGLYPPLRVFDTISCDKLIHTGLLLESRASKMPQQLRSEDVQKCAVVKADSQRSFEAQNAVGKSQDHATILHPFRPIPKTLFLRKMPLRHGQEP